MLEEWEEIVPPTQRRELIMNDAMFAIPSERSLSSSSFKPSVPPVFLPTSLDSLDLSADSAQLSSALAVPPRKTGTQAPRKRTGVDREPLASVVPAVPDTDEEKARRDHRHKST